MLLCVSLTTYGRSSAVDSTATNKLRVCICTSYSAAAEPRAPRHALAIAALGKEYEVIFVECAARGTPASPYDPFDGVPNIRRVSHRYAHRRGGVVRLIFDKAARLLARQLFKWFGFLHPIALNTRFLGYEALLRSIQADVYIGHNVETLVPTCHAAKANDAAAMFDCMEFYSDMGDGQNRLDRRIIERMERTYLPQCALVLASSEEMADALAATYRMRRPLGLYNVPPTDPHHHICEHPGLSLYWRNSVIGFGQRGLQDALEAMLNVPNDVTLHLQGRLPTDGGVQLRARIVELGLDGRVFIHGPYSPPDAVRTASQYCVGLCLERSGIRNHDLTVSNKMFDYLMAGLVVITSDLPSLRGVIERSQGGLCFEPGNPADLAAKINIVRDDRDFRLTLARKARSFATAIGNRETEVARFQASFLQAIQPAHTETAAIANR